ncbi:MAG: GNAT family N-acetyltransferase [Gammaproteobacteria bacterium]|nr:GNAT family N-acetyltransferase [Gammaproteobacteria bacterium]
MIEARAVMAADAHALATGGMEHSSSPGSIRRNMPDTVPVMILARLAVARIHQSRGGRALVQDALLRTLRAAEATGMRAVTIHALDKQAVAFYRYLGFKPSPVDDFILFARSVCVLAAIEPCSD